MKTMKPIKPKEMAMMLGISASRLSRYADEIELANAYRFNRTPLGSLLFKEDDLTVLKDYIQVANFFGRKKESIEMFREMAGDKYKPHEPPSWMRLMPNAVWI